MEHFELFIDRALLNCDFERDGESPSPVWKLYADHNGQIYEYVGDHWHHHAEAQEAKAKIGLAVTSSSHLNEDWMAVK